MFTGIIQSTGKLRNEKNKSIIEVLENNFEMNIGDSIAVDGICLTVKEIFGNSFSVDISEETLNKTTLGNNYSSNKYSVSEKQRMMEHLTIPKRTIPRKRTHKLNKISQSNILKN